MTNNYKVIFSVVLLGLLILLYQNNQLKNDLKSLNESSAIQAHANEEKESEIMKLTNNYQEVLKANKSLEKEIKLLNKNLEEFKVLNVAITQYKLKDMGIDDYRIIEEDLLSKSELISIDGVLGGTMYFTEVHLLNHQWAYASFEDGHIMGSGIYEYEILANGEIRWKEIQATSD